MSDPRNVFLCAEERDRRIVGSNGSGKSTLIELLNGLLIPSHGKITINGRIITGGEGTDLLRDVGVVFQQSDDQLFAPTVPDDMIIVLSTWK